MGQDQARFLPELERLGRLWLTPDLANRCRVEFSRRLRRSLGLCYPQRDLIRLNPVLLEDGNTEVLAETLVHEAAHLAVFHHHGSRVRPHGPRWQRLMRLAGLPARATIAQSRIKAMPALGRSRYLYRHRCEDCGQVFNTARTDHRWRCSVCHQRGRGGLLKVLRLPLAR